MFCDREFWYSRPGPGEEDFPFPAPFDTGFYLIMNVAVGGTFTGGPIDEVRPRLRRVRMRLWSLHGEFFMLSRALALFSGECPPRSITPDENGALAE